jgi:hypothetical protein
LIRAGDTPETIAGTNVTGLVLAKYTPEGQALWARTVASGSAVFPQGLVIDPSGAVYWTAFLTGQTAIGATNLSNTGYGSSLVVKCNGEGVLAWVKAVRGPTTNSVTLGEPALGPTGDLYVCGHFVGVADFASTNLTTAGDGDILLAKYNSSGDLLWAKQAGGNGHQYVHRNTLDADGNFIISGTFSHTATFGSIALSNSIATDGYMVAKYNSDGEVLWARALCEGASRFGVAADQDGNVYFAGDTYTNVCFAKLDAAGELKWTRTIAGRMMLAWLHSDAMGHCYLSGQFSAPVLAFDAHELTFSRPNTFDSWIARLDTTTLPMLRIQSAADTVSLSWPVVADGFHLESSVNPEEPNSWLSNATPPVISGEVHVVPAPTAGNHSFFRLRR